MKMKQFYGKYCYEDGSEYIGQWDSSGLRHGIGRLELSDTRNIYTGQFHRGFAHGLGVLKTTYFTLEGQFNQVS